MNRLKLGECFFVLLFLCLNHAVYAQVVHAFSAGDTLFKYTTNLYKDYTKFSDIRMFGLDFPCVERIHAVTSNKTNATLELHSNLRKEYLNLKGTTMSVVGFQDVDAFLGLPGKTVFLDNMVPISRSTHKDDFYNKVKSDVTYTYKTSDLNGELRIWADKNGITQIRVLSNLTWVTQYKNKDSFDNLEELIEGFVIENKKTFKVKSLEVKKENWGDCRGFLE